MSGSEYFELRRQAGKPIKPCPSCGSTEDLGLILMAENHPHWAAIVCHHCPTTFGGIEARPGLHLTRVDWAAKPANLTRNKPQRGDKGKHLVSIIRTAWGDEPLYCIICLRDERFLPDTYLIGHHIIEDTDGGAATAANLVPMCQQCHELVHWRRKTVHGEQAGKPMREVAHASR